MPASFSAISPFGIDQAPSSGVERPAGAQGSWAGWGPWARAPADVLGQRAPAEADPRLGEELRAVMGAAIRSVGRRPGGTQTSQGGRSWRWRVAVRHW